MNPTVSQPYLLKYVDRVTPVPNGVDFWLTGMAAKSLPDTPGWLTGEPPLAQGIETTMPNLPRDLQLPGLDQVRYRGRVVAMGPETLRVAIAPADHQMWDEPDTWPGILIATTTGDPVAEVCESEHSLEIRLPGCSLRIGRSPFTLALHRGDQLLLRTGERLRQVAGFPMAPPLIVNDNTININFEMAVDERIHGFGEQFSRFDKNGQELVLKVNDALGTGTGRTYKPVPLWHSTLGYSCLINTGAIVTADVGHHRPSVLGISLDDGGLDLVLFGAPTLKERLRDYTALTGRAERPPLWAFGYWMGRCRYHSSTEMIQVGQTMRANNVPADVLHLDPDWLIVDRLNTDFIWNEDRFGERSRFIAALAELGLRLSMWQLPYLDPASPVFEEAEQGGHLLRMADGSLAEIQGTPTPDGRMRALFDVTNPATHDWLVEKERPFFDDGLAVIKTDFGEGCPPGASAADGTPGNYIHNLYPLRYNEMFFNITRELTGRQPLVWGRSGWAGSHRLPGQWGGDAESTVVGMQATLRGGLSYATCAPGFWSHDIGGFYGPELTPGLYIRWTQLGAFSPLMRAHGLRPREPWEFGERALEICRDWIRLRYSLLPYIWQVGRQVQQDGLPFIRPLCLEYDDDRIAPEVDDQYFFGPDLLIAPIMDDTMEPVERTIYLPQGTWYDFFTGEKFHGPGFITRKVSIDQMPILVREGAVIPRVEVDESIRCTADLVGLPWQVHIWGGVPDDAVGALEGFDQAPRIARIIHHD